MIQKISQKKFLSVILAITMVLPSLLPLTFSFNVKATEDTAAGFYHVEGNQVIDPAGNAAILKGMSFGNTNYGNPSDISQGPSANHEEISYRELAEMGIDHVRFEFNYSLFEDDTNPYVYKEAGFEWLNQNIKWAKKYGIHLIFQMKHPQGGYQASSPNYDLSSLDSGGKALWMGPNYQSNQNRLIALWKEIATRYANEPTIIGYGLVNEPTVPQKSTAQETVNQWKNLAQRITDTIRQVDRNHILFVECVVGTFHESNYNSTDWNQLTIENSQFLINDNNTVYEFHFYEPFPFTHQGAFWWPEMQGIETYYPSDTVVSSNIQYGNWKGSADAAATQTVENDWTYFESQAFSATDTYNYGSIAMNANAIGSGTTVYYDDVVVTRYDNQGNSKVMASYDFSENNIWPSSFWASNSVGTAGWSSAQGHDGAGSLSISGTTSNGNYSMDWVYLKPGYTYKISGWVKNPVPGACPSVSFYPATDVYEMNQEYLQHKMDMYTAFGRTYNVPQFVGEWGVINNSYGKGEDKYVKDLTNLFIQYGLSSNYHSYHDSTMGLYLKEEYEERGQRNDILYHLLTTCYSTPVELPEIPLDKPDPPTEKPDPPTEKPDPPTEKPDPPTEKPDPPTEKPDPPAEEKPAPAVPISSCTITLKKSSYPYTGTAVKPKMTVQYGKTLLTANKDYKVSYKNNVKAGKATITITGMGHYSGTVKKFFKIVLPKGKTFAAGAYKYEITSSSTAAFAGLKNARTKKVSIPKTVKIVGKTFKVTSIKAKALYKKAKVTQIKIGVNVKSIGKNAFFGCKKLKTVTIKSSLFKTAGKNAFKGTKIKIIKF